MSNVPRQQQKQLAEAEELHRRFYGTPDAEEAAAEGEGEGESEATTAPDLTVVDKKKSAPTAEAAPVADPYKGDYTKLLQAHRTLQGKYESEGKQMSERMSAMSGRLHDMERLLANPPTPAQPIEAGETQASLLSAQEVEDYGQDMIDVVKRAAREEVGQELAQIRAQNAQLRQQLGGVEQTTQRSARQTMLDYLDREMSVWRQINTDEAFVQWAEDFDTFSGRSRIEMLRAAFEANNGTRVLAFFKAFANENAAFKTDVQTETARPQVDLNTLVAPGRAGNNGGVPRAQEEGNLKTYTQAEIGKFYRDVNSGAYKDRPAEKAATEKDIFAAQSSGRIVG